MDTGVRYVGVKLMPEAVNYDNSDNSGKFMVTRIFKMSDEDPVSKDLTIPFREQRTTPCRTLFLPIISMEVLTFSTAFSMRRRSSLLRPKAKT